MKYFIIFISLIGCVFADEQLKIVATKQLPIEIKIIFDSYQNQNLDNYKYQELLKHAQTIDSIATKINKEDLYFVIKTEFYKSLLRMNSHETTLANERDLEKLTKAISLSKDPLVNWILNTSTSDLNNILNSKDYRSYVVKTGNKEISKNLDEKRMLKKLLLISRVIKSIDIESPDNSRFAYYPFIIDFLKNLEESLFLMSNQNSLSFALKKTEELVYFKLEKMVEPAKSPTKSTEKSVEDIIDEKNESSDQIKLPVPSNDNWLDDDSEIKSIKNLPKPTNDAEWLQDI